MRANLQTPRIVRVINVSGYLISAHKSDEKLKEVLGSLLIWVSNLLQELGGMLFSLFNLLV